MDNKVSLESMLRLAAAELDEQEYQEFKELEQANKLDEPSDEFTQKMQGLLNKEKRSDNFLTFRRTLSKVAVYFLISFSMISMTFLSASAVRESVAEVILEWYDGFTRVFIVNEIVPPTIGEVEFGFIPDGFEMIPDENQLTNVKRFYFENEAGDFIHIKISLSETDKITNVDNDTLTYHKLVIDDISGLWFEENDYNTVIISNNGLTYVINGYINLEDIINIYKNIKIM